MAKVVLIKNLDDLMYLECGEKILEYSTTYLTSPGDNYGSIMIDLNIKTTKQNYNFVAKLPPQTPEQWDAFDVSVSFKKESNMYAEIIPILHKFRLENSITNENIIKFFPRFYNMRFNADKLPDVDENAVLIIENLKSLNFQCLDRLIGFNDHQTTKIIKQLAEFQATVNALIKKWPEKFQQIIMPNLVRNKQIDFTPSLTKTFRSLRKICNLSETEFHNLETVLMDGLTEFQQKNNNASLHKDFATLVHNDFWINNIMCSETTEEVKFLDFQMMQYGSCVYDLLFLLFTSVHNDIVKLSFDKYVKTYFETYVETLNKLNVNTVECSLEMFYSEVKKYAAEVALHAYLMSPIICSEKGVAVNFDPDVDVIINSYYENKCKTILFLLTNNKLIII